MADIRQLCTNFLEAVLAWLAQEPSTPINLAARASLKWSLFASSMLSEERFNFFITNRKSLNLDDIEHLNWALAQEGHGGVLRGGVEFSRRIGYPMQCGDVRDIMELQRLADADLHPRLLAEALATRIGESHNSFLDKQIFHSLSSILIKLEAEGSPDNSMTTVETVSTSL
jgi:hypothetical protein